MVTFGPGSESGALSLRPVVTSLYTKLFVGYTAALIGRWCSSITVHCTLLTTDVVIFLIACQAL